VKAWRAIAIAAGVAGCGGDGGGRDAAPTDWIAGPAMPGARLEPGVAAVGGQLAVVGGFDASLQIVKTGYVLDPIAETWAALPDAPVAWTHVGLASRGGALFLLGGLEGTDYIPHGEAYVLDPAATEWQALPAMPAGYERGAAGIAVGPSYIFVVGGADQTDALATALAYDVGAQTWSVLPDLPSPRSHPAAYALADGSVIVAGGLATIDASMPMAETLVLPPGAPAWQPLAPMPSGAARGGCAYGSLGTQLICAGGEAQTSAIIRVDAYDVASDTWTRLEDLPDPRAGTQGATVGARFFLAGGARHLAFDPLDTLFIYAPR
jgi:non-specific serine/threonine protein kinase